MRQSLENEVINLLKSKKVDNPESLTLEGMIVELEILLYESNSRDEKYYSELISELYDRLPIVKI